MFLTILWESWRDWKVDIFMFKILPPHTKHLREEFRKEARVFMLKRRKR